MLYVNSLSFRQNDATPVRPLNSIPRNQSLFQAHLNAIPVRSASTPAPAQTPKVTTTLALESQGNNARQILGTSPAPTAVQLDPVKAHVAATPFSGTATPAVAATTQNPAADFDQAMQISSHSNTPTPLVRADGSLDWDAYTNNITDPQLKADMVNQLTFDYHYRQAGAAGQRPADNTVDNWGWDPYKTMQMRKQYGYTWVPAANQAPIAVAPGLSVPGTAPYKPAQPPDGSIIVS